MKNNFLRLLWDFIISLMKTIDMSTYFSVDSQESFS